MVVLVRMAVFRILPTFRGQLRPEDFAVGESSAVPARISVINRNYMNLLELPVLFYAITLIAFVTNNASSLVVGLAWGYATLRIIHSLIHLSCNHVVSRVVAFALSNFVLSAIWVVVGLGLLK